MFEKIKLEPLNQFYPVKLDEMKNSESKLAIQSLSSSRNFTWKLDMAF
ncbi:Uncharacterised protein [Streptococcus cristatus]|nr:Uncharacterised protein [Streptococcus cristatus]